MPTPIPTPTLPATPMSVPTPSPSPSVLHVVMDGGAPVWLGPLLTGVFVLAAAVIALVSLYFSDRRKLRREDLRQWDDQLTDAYVKIINKTNEVGHVLLENELSGTKKGDRLADVTIDAVQELQQQQLRLELITKKRVTDAAEAIVWLLTEVYRQTFMGQRGGGDLRRDWTRTKSNELGELQGVLRDEVRRALRIPRR